MGCGSSLINPNNANSDIAEKELGDERDSSLVGTSLAHAPKNAPRDLRCHEEERTENINGTDAKRSLSTLQADRVRAVDVEQEVPVVAGVSSTQEKKEKSIVVGAPQRDLTSSACEQTERACEAKHEATVAIANVDCNGAAVTEVKRCVSSTSHSHSTSEMIRIDVKEDAPMSLFLRSGGCDSIPNVHVNNNSHFASVSSNPVAARCGVDELPSCSSLAGKGDTTVTANARIPANFARSQQGKRLAELLQLIAAEEQRKTKVEESLSEGRKQLALKKESVERLMREQEELTAQKAQLEKECAANNRELARYKARYEREIAPLNSELACLREECSDLRSAFLDMQRVLRDLGKAALASPTVASPILLDATNSNLNV